MGAGEYPRYRAAPGWPDRRGFRDGCQVRGWVQSLLGGWHHTCCSSGVTVSPSAEGWGRPSWVQVWWAVSLVCQGLWVPSNVTRKP